MVTGLIIVGLHSHSLGVLAAGGDYLADSAAICLGLLSIYISHHPRGYAKATSVAALINGLALLVVTGFVLFEAIRRLTSHTPEIAGLPVLIISFIATLVMLASAVILGRGAADEDLHMRSVLLDTLADAASAAAVGIAGGIIYLTKGFYWLDSVASLLIGLIIGYNALKLLRDVIYDLRGKPKGS